MMVSLYKDANNERKALGLTLKINEERSATYSKMIEEENRNRL